MTCVRPPLLKKPSRGFAWACGPCNRAQERKLEARNTPALNGSGNNTSGDGDEDIDNDEEDDVSGSNGVGTESSSEVMDLDKQAEPTPEQLGFARMWQMRYLGQHCRVEDALDYDDRIYPRAASRLGTKHQAVVAPWPGRPVEYIKPPEKKKYKGGNKSKAQLEAEAAAKDRPKWVMEEPPGYIERGKDDGTTSTLMFKIPDEGSTTQDGTKANSHEEYYDIVDNYMFASQDYAERIGVKSYTANFQDKALQILMESNFNEKKALNNLSKVQAVRDVKEIRLKPDEIKRFAEGVAKYGSELHMVAKHVKTRKEAEIVRHYYLWKKSPEGKEIWGNYDGRKGKKEAKLKDKDATSSSKLVDDVADDSDDSAFDIEKASDKKRGFECKFCQTRHSRQWRRAPGVAPGTLISAEGKGANKRKNTDEKWLVSALCRRCAELWRKYAIRWEDPDEANKQRNAGNRQWKRKIDEETLRELFLAQELFREEEAKAQNTAADSNASVTPQPSINGSATPDARELPPKKKTKLDKKKEKGKGPGKKAAEEATLEAARPREKTPERVKEPPPPPPEPPKPKIATCGVCKEVEELGKQHAVCRDCKMTVHKRCYGVGEIIRANKWVCEMCANDRNPTVSTVCIFGSIVGT